MLHPQAQALLDELVASERPSSMSLPLPEGRRNFDEMFTSLGDGPEVATDERTIRGPGGDVTLRLYRPSRAPGLPMMVFFHGGGWVFGSLDSHDSLCRRLTTASAAMVVSVGFRLAPEAPFPAALEDCLAATTWVQEHGAELEGDSWRLGVAGDSSGATLAAAVALRARDDGRPSIAHQLLAYPATDPSMSTPSYQEFAEDPFLSKAEMTWYWTQYLPTGEDRQSPYAAPGLADDLSRLPPAYLVLAENDPLRDDGQVFADRLWEAGVRVTVRRYPGMVHGFLSMTRSLEDGRRAIAEAGRVVGQALRG